MDENHTKIHTNGGPDFTDALHVEMNILERKIGACIFNHPAETIAKMDEFKTYPESAVDVVYFWKRIKANMPRIALGSWHEAFPVIQGCLYHPDNIHKWESLLYEDDIPEIYENLLTDMPVFIITLKRRRTLLRLYIDWQMSNTFKRLMRGYDDRLRE